MAHNPHDGGTFGIKRNRALSIHRKREKGVEMPDTTAMQEDTAQAGTTEEQAFQPVTFNTQEELDKHDARIRRATKEKYAGYEEYKETADAYDQLQEASKTELQKAQEEVARLSAELKEKQDREERETLRAEVAREMDVPAELIKGDDREEMEAHAEALKKYLRTDAAPVVPSDGYKPGSNAQVSNRDRFAQFVDDSNLFKR